MSRTPMTSTAPRFSDCIYASLSPTKRQYSISPKSCLTLLEPSSMMHKRQPARWEVLASPNWSSSLSSPSLSLGRKSCPSLAALSARPWLSSGSTRRNCAWPSTRRCASSNATRRNSRPKPVRRLSLRHPLCRPRARSALRLSTPTSMSRPSPPRLRSALGSRLRERNLRMVTPSQTEPPEEQDDRTGKMSFFDHLVELRKRLIHSLVAVGIGLCIGIYFADKAYDFIVRPMHKALRDAKLQDHLVYLTPITPIQLYITVG